MRIVPDPCTSPACVQPILLSVSNETIEERKRAPWYGLGGLQCGLWFIAVTEKLSLFIITDATRGNTTDHRRSSVEPATAARRSNLCSHLSPSTNSDWTCALMSFNSSQRWSSMQPPLINVTADGWTWFLGHQHLVWSIHPVSLSAAKLCHCSHSIREVLCLLFQLKHFFCRKTSQRHRQLSSKIYASSLCKETCCTSLFGFYLWLFPSLASDFISFLWLLNLIVKLDVLQISQPALSSLSAWTASQINRRKWIIRCDY